MSGIVRRVCTGLPGEAKFRRLSWRVIVFCLLSRVVFCIYPSVFDDRQSSRGNEQHGCDRAAFQAYEWSFCTLKQSCKRGTIEAVDEGRVYTTRIDRK